LDERAKIGVAEFESSQPARGEKTLRGVLAEDPRHAGALVGLGMVALQRGQDADAVKLLDDALQAAPKDFNVRMARAFYFNHKHDALRARQEFEAAHQIAPAEAGPVYNIAALKRRQGDLQGAREDFKQYLALSPNAPDRRDVEEILTDLDAKIAGGGR
jgi:Tfp pilus assembly protein PilF